jgi:hypothetical protein
MGGVAFRSGWLSPPLLTWSSRQIALGDFISEQVFHGLGDKCDSHLGFNALAW